MTTQMTTNQVIEEIAEGIRRKLEPKNFKTGSRGFGAYGKIEVDGKRYQLSVSVTEVGSKG